MTKGMDPATREKVKGAKVLAVGAGGIGCELLKTLVLTGFEDIEVIDMDTIETSNLNRQFLFRKQHVGESKAKVASAAVQAMRPGVRIKHYHANVKEGCGEVQFGTAFFKRFSIVLNGLDNLEARRHVNRLCLAAEVPLVESGTAGHLGQVTVHIKGQTECFECQPKPAPKSFPVCTIRNTPDKPIHCVVWAKDLLFNRLFGRADGPTDLDEEKDGEQEEGEDEGDVATFFKVGEGESSIAFASRIFQRVFCDDIDRVLRMEDLWEKRAKPSPLALAGLVPAGWHPPGGDAASASSALGYKNTHSVWTREECALVFIESIRRFLETRAGDVGEAVFDKDDALAVDLVVAAANLRSYNYGIPPQSLFAAKGMAGNIIHAVATTNAIVSGLIVIEAVKVLAGAAGEARMTYVKEFATGKKLLQPVEPAQANGKCYVCSRARLYLQVNTRRVSLKTVLDEVVRGRMGINVPEVSFSRDGRDFCYEEGDGLDGDEVEENAAHAAKLLCDLPAGGVVDDTLLHVSDFTQGLEACEVMVCHVEDIRHEEGEDPALWKLEGKIPSASAAGGDGAGGAGAEDGAGGAGGVKRGAGGVGGEDGQAAKRSKGAASDVIEL